MYQCTLLWNRSKYDESEPCGGIGNIRKECVKIGASTISRIKSSSKLRLKSTGICTQKVIVSASRLGVSDTLGMIVGRRHGNDA
jgi:hypothetical protein